MMIFDVFQVLRINQMHMKTFHNGTFGQVFHRLLEVTKNQRSSYELWYPPGSLHHSQNLLHSNMTTRTLNLFLLCMDTNHEPSLFIILLLYEKHKLF